MNNESGGWLSVEGQPQGRGKALRTAAFAAHLFNSSCQANLQDPVKFRTQNMQIMFALLKEDQESTDTLMVQGIGSTAYAAPEFKFAK